MRHIGADFAGPVHCAPLRKGFPDGEWEDVWGVRYRSMPNRYGGVHHDVIVSPLAGATSVAEVEKYSWPSVDDCYSFTEIAARCKSLREYALFGGYAHFYCPGADLRSYATWLMDLAECSALAEAILAKFEEFWLQFSERVYAEAGGKLDIFFMADDYGMQSQMLMSPSCWRRVFKPVVKRFMDWAHARGMRTMLHSCGSIRPIIPDLIECGVDILDPVQPLAAGMNPYELKREFGRDLCFHGAVDIQQLLPHGSADEVRDEVRRLTEVLGSDGGYILCPAHVVQADVPLENILAVYE